MAVLGLLGSLVLTGCGSKSDPTPTDPTTPSETRTTLPPQTRQIEVAVGESKQVGLGRMNLSVGDNWGVASQQPSGIVEAKLVTGRDVFGYTPAPGEEGATGAWTVGAIQITGTKPGTTKLKVVYCFQSEIRQGCVRQNVRNDQNPPRVITVTVR